MSSRDEIIQRSLEAIAQELEEENVLGKKHPVRSLQILLPTSPYKLTDVWRYSIAREEEKYKEAVTHFLQVDPNDGRVKRSLFFLLYDKPFYYDKLDTSSECSNSSYGFLIDPISIEQHDRIRLSGLEPNKTWKKWLDTLKAKKYGQSTLWSYIKINLKNPSNIEDRAIIAAFLTFDGHIDQKERDNYLRLSLANKKVQDHLYTLTLSLFRDEISKNALRSAISAIMGRNMSHNIGSHVLSTVTTTTDRFNFKDDQVLFKYLQHRMDFISLISTEFPSWTTPAWFLREIMREFYNQHHLLNYLGISEGLRAYNHDNTTKGKLVVKVGICKSEKEQFTEVTDFSRDFQLAIPGGLIGHHALYVILEGIIRNAAKHGYSKLKNRPNVNLEVEIKIINDPKADHVRCQVFDNIPCNEELHYDINGKLGLSLLHKDGAMRKEDWGLNEMKISAGYLQEKEIQEIGGESENNLKVFKAIRKTNGEGKHYLGYEFTVPKPKEVLIVDENVEEKTDGNVYWKLSEPDFCDYEFCVLVDKDGSGVELLEKFKQLTENNLADISGEISQLLIRYPARLFVVTDTLDFDYGSILSLDKRLVAIRKSEWEVIQEKDGKSLKEWLYGQWLKHLKVKNNIKKQVTLVLDTEGVESELNSDNPFEKLLNGIEIPKNVEVELEKRLVELEKHLGLTQYIPGTLPPYFRNFRPVNNEFPRNYFDWVSLRRNSGENDEKCLIQYKRHSQVLGETKANYAEDLSGIAIHFPLLAFSGNDEYQKFKLLSQCLENGLIKIGICDERASQSTLMKSREYSDTDTNTVHIEILQKAGLYIINKFKKFSQEICIDGNYKWCSQLKNNGKLFFKGFEGNPEIVNLDILIIHQGILDKEVEEEGSKKQEIEKIIDSLKQCIPHVVVTSGRGVPVDLPANAKFIPFSVIESFVISKPHHKFLLTQALLTLIHKPEDYEKASTIHPNKRRR